MGAGDLDAYRRSGIRAVQSTPLISRSGDLLGMISTHWREPHQPTELELRTFDVLARQAADLLDRARIEEQARGLAAIVESNNDAIISMNLDGLITSWNKSAERIYGYLSEEIIGKPILILIPQERHGEESTILARIRRGERVDHYETIRRHKDGSLIDVSLTISPVRDVGDKIVGASKIARDISERKRSEALVVTLVREAEHRARNVLAVVQAMVRLSQSETPEGLKAAIDGRIRALANVHTLFVQSRWAGASLRTLIEEELAPYLRGEGHTRVEGPTVLLSQDGAQTLALAVHELATNAAKYGALSVEEGRVDVEWSRTPDGMLHIRWTESGGPQVRTPSRSGVGTRVVENMIRAVNGKLQVNWRAEGFQCEFALPVAGVEVTR
jgi:PAS domain S-box-containing protein